MAARIVPLLSAFAGLSYARTVRSPTPPMGWNSYNSYSCSPSEDKIKASARSLVDLGLSSLGYNFATVDCGWPSRDRDSEGRLQWNETLFPSGGKALGDYLHGLGLGFGLYSGAGYLQCGSTDLPASLDFEGIDAESFAEWGGDSLKYDNCYATSRTVMVDADSAEAQSPARFQRMADTLEAVDRDIQYFVCQWGIGTDVGAWASAIGNTWRISNDIYNAWRSIWRITNQVVPYYKRTTVGAFADMDMLIVGLNALSVEEERFHFGMWAINKSPLIIGAVLNSPMLSKASVELLSNKEVIAINQDSLAKQAQLVRRYTEEEWDIWLGELSGDRKVLGIANWKNESQSIEVDLGSLGIFSATARDVWTATDVGSVNGVQNIALAGHEMKLWVLSDISLTSLRSVGYYSAAGATLGGSARLVGCPNQECQPTGQKIGEIGSGASASFHSISAVSSGKKVVGVDFVNYDYAFQTAWGWGSNTRNMTITVNGGTQKRWAFPLSGGDWWETGRLSIEVDGFVAGGNNSITFRSADGTWAPDLVGVEVFG
ncbi:carbohydrate-binding module family 35 protein [Lentithecium fluviatile CBS 122367]|uniref:Alpha-galactosidase n=1 Tax=Lentithecium fluviatile CBS 122367 TaxID=1168545 RepID=A0A6G1JL96_9PLEO|nr:carbohydrate-binding module family 35 protein [Lentithecium fluviatile CBS 122367]